MVQQAGLPAPQMHMDLPLGDDRVDTRWIYDVLCAAYAGNYWSDELRATYRLAIGDGKLWMKALIGADGIVHEGTVPFDELRPTVTDEFDLKGAPLVFHFMRDAKGRVTGFTLNGFHERGILFSRSEYTE